jgi:hypothetical protein
MRDFPQTATRSCLAEAILVLLVMMLSFGMLGAQPPDSTWNDDIDSTWGSGADSTWDDLVLNPDDFDFGGELMGHYSHGWFPQPFYATSLSFTSDFLYVDVFDRATDIRSRSFRPTTAPFSWRNPFDGEEQVILESENIDEVEDYPETSYDEYALTYLMNLPLPAIVRLGGALQITDGLLFAEDTTRMFLGVNGLKRPLKEVGVVHLREYLLAGRAGLNIPFYGVFLKSELADIYSYYYLHGSVVGAYAIASRAVQYSQIANVKNELRYQNNGDTATLMYKERFRDLDPVRLGLDVGIGFNFGAEFGTIGFESFISIPYSSVLRDVEWKQYIAGFRLSLGYIWIPERKRRIR